MPSGSPVGSAAAFPATAAAAAGCCACKLPAPDARAGWLGLLLLLPDACGLLVAVACVLPMRAPVAARTAVAGNLLRAALLKPRSVTNQVLAARSSCGSVWTVCRGGCVGGEGPLHCAAHASPFPVHPASGNRHTVQGEAPHCTLAAHQAATEHQRLGGRHAPPAARRRCAAVARMCTVLGQQRPLLAVAAPLCHRHCSW